MEIQSLKSEFVKNILATESKDLRDKFWATLKLEEKDFGLNLRMLRNVKLKSDSNK